MIQTAQTSQGTRRRRAAVQVVGVDGRGCAGLSSDTLERVAQAQVLVGSSRQLAFFPQHAGTTIDLAVGVSAAVEQVLECSHEDQVCVLASGDPLFFGIAALLLRRLDPRDVEIVPAPSSVQEAFARAQVPWSKAALISVHGRPLEGVVSRLRSRSCAGILTDATNSPDRIAAHLRVYGDTQWRAVVCERLGMPEERVRSFDDLQALEQTRDFDPLNVLVLQRTKPGWRPAATLPCLEEERFAKKMPKLGLITKREVRALSIALLRLGPDAKVWDVGAGSGSVSVEASMMCPEGHVYAIETDAECAQYCRDNALLHGADNLTVVEGRAPEALEGLPTPDAVFVGGSKGSLEQIVERAHQAMQSGGRLVINAITLESVAGTRDCLRTFGLEPELSLIQVSRGAKLARYLRYDALNPVHIFAATVPVPGSEDPR